jgi:mannose-1-phosphate guanylyltransferase/mannose-6-phosphate isomerase
MTHNPSSLARHHGRRLRHTAVAAVAIAGFPKQFLVLSGNTSLFQQAVARLRAWPTRRSAVAAALVVGNEEHRFLVLDQLRELKVEPSAVMLEPMGRNTAPAVTLAALQALETGSDPVLVVTPADQTVTDGAAFTAALRRAVQVRLMAPSPSWASRPTGPRPATATSGPKAAAWRSSSKNPTWPRPRSTWPTAATSGTPACSCCEASVWMAALQRFRPDIASACRGLCGAQDRRASSCAPARPNSPPCPANRWTTR